MKLLRKFSIGKAQANKYNSYVYSSMKSVVAVALGVVLGLLTFVAIVAVLNRCGCCGRNANGSRGGVADVLARLLLPPPLRRMLGITAYDRVLSASSSHRGSDDDMGMELGFGGSGSSSSGGGSGNHQLNEEEREFKRIIEMRGEELGRALFNEDMVVPDAEDDYDDAGIGIGGTDFDSRDRDRLSMLETYRSHLLSSAASSSSGSSSASAAAQAGGLLEESALRL